MCIVAHDNQVSQDFGVCHYSCSKHLLCLFHVSKVSDQRSEPDPELPQLDEESCEELGTVASVIDVTSMEPKGTRYQL